jgi:hypothetical protein
MHPDSGMLRYHRERQAELVREARRSDEARAFSVSRTEERRSLLRRAWQRRFATPTIAELPPEAPPARTAP